MKRIIIRIQKRAGMTGWWVRVEGLELRSERQDTAIGAAVSLAKWHHKSGGKAQVVLHGADGKIRWERTYPDETPQRKG